VERYLLKSSGKIQAKTPQQQQEVKTTNSYNKELYLDT
jgi:hypothetical protein